MIVYQYCNKCKTETVQELTSITKSTVEYICKGLIDHEGNYKLHIKELKLNEASKFNLIRLG